jgi:serine protease Do
MKLQKKLERHLCVWAGLAMCALAAGAWLGVATNQSVQAAREPAAAAAATPLAVPQPEKLSGSFSELAKRLQPSVVKITSTGDGGAARSRASQDSQDDPDQDQEDFQDQLRRFFGGRLPNTPQRVYHGGSGVIVDPKGYILTNNHVVANASRIQVKLFGDPAQYNARLIGTDPETDLAVIRLDIGKPLPAAEMGNSDAIQVGDWVVAIGSPFGFLEATVTAGIISAKGRDLGDPAHQLQRFLQTDAAINYGNSGGPLINLRGEVIGISTAMASDTGGYAGIGFALPVNMAVRIYNEIIRTGKVSRGAIGIDFNREQNPALLKAYGASSGVFVQSVRPGGPSDRAGIQPGDIIVSFQGQPVHTSEDLLEKVANAAVGAPATVTILREGRKMDLRLTMGDRAALASGSSKSTAGPAPEAVPEPAGGLRLGVSIRPLSAADRDRLQLPETAGVLIVKVEPGSFAEDIGIQEEDVITAMNRQPIRSVEDLRHVQQSLRSGEPLAFRILRNTRRGGASWQPLYLAGTLPRP